MVDIDIRVSSNLKEELTWAIDKRLQVISNYNVIYKTVRVEGSVTSEFGVRDLKTNSFCT